MRWLKNDLETTAPYLSNDVNIGQVTQAAAYHLLAKIDLALGEFDAAIEACNKVIGDGVHHLMKERFGVDKNDPTKNVVWDLHQSENKHLPENKEVLYIVLDNYDETDARSATGLEIKRQILPMYSATTSNIKTPNGKKAFVDNDEKKIHTCRIWSRHLYASTDMVCHSHDLDIRQYRLTSCSRKLDANGRFDL